MNTRTGLPAPTDPPSAQAWLATLAATGQRHVLTVQGRRVVWRSFGAPAAPTLVLLHGGHGSWLHWARNIGALAASHHVLVADLPGCGESDAPAAPTLDALVADLRSSLGMLLGADTPLTLIGFSFGGLVAAQLAAQRAAMRGAVTRLALLGPGGHGGARRPRGELQPWREAWRRGDAAALAAATRHNLQVHMLHAAGAVDALAVQIHTQSCVQTRFHSKPISRSALLAPVLEHHQGALLLIWGEHDVTARPAELAPALVQGRARTRVHIVADAGHWVQYEQAAPVNRLLLDWLADTAPTPPA